MELVKIQKWYRAVCQLCHSQTTGMTTWALYVFDTGQSTRLRSELPHDSLSFPEGNMLPRKIRCRDAHCHCCFFIRSRSRASTRHSCRIMKERMSKFLNLLLWTLLIARAAAVPVSLYGLNYNTRQGPDWDWDKCKSREQVVTDLALLQTLTSRIRILSLVDCGQGYLVLDVAKELGLQVWLGMWVSADENVFLQEKAIIEDMLNQGLLNDNTVLGISVGSESIYRKEVTARKIIEYRAQVKALCVAAGMADLPVSIVDIAPIYEQYPQLISAVDVVITNSFPFWENIAIDAATDYLVTEIDPIRRQAEAQNKEVILGETGWPSDGFNPDTAVASPELQTAYFQFFFCRMDRELNWAYYYFTGIDNAWRREQDPNNTIEGNFGFFYADLTMKPHFRDLVFTCPGSSVEYSFLEIGDPATRDPATSRPPTSLPVSSPASCSVHSGCEALGGNCCPTDSGDYLGCCDTTALPTIAMTISPTTLSPTASPTEPPAVTETESPVATSTQSPTSLPFVASTASPTVSPTGSPIVAETESPVATSTQSPTDSPVVVSIAPLAASPTKPPSAQPTLATNAPTLAMTPGAFKSPTKSPSKTAPSVSIGASPPPTMPLSSAPPGNIPSFDRTLAPTGIASGLPSKLPASPLSMMPLSTALPASIPSAVDLPSLFLTSNGAVAGQFWYGTLVTSIIFCSWYIFQ